MPSLSHMYCLCIFLLNYCCSEKSVLVSVAYSVADIVSPPANFSVPSDNLILPTECEKARSELKSFVIIPDYNSIREIEWHHDDGVSSIPWTNSDDDGIWVIERYSDYD